MTSEPPIQLTVSDEEAGTRLDRFLTTRLDHFSRNQVQQLNSAGGVAVSGRVRPHSYSVSAGDVVTVDPSQLPSVGLTEDEMPAAQSIPLALTYEDEHIVVINKAVGMVTHPAHGNWDGTLVNALLGRGTTLAELGLPERPGVVHRLDKETSGLIVVARTDEAYRGMVAAIKGGEFHKIYHAISWGHLSKRHMLIDAPIARHATRRQQMAVVEDRGKPAQTDLLVVDRYMHFDYSRVTTYTGRTHQIRVHLAHVGHPLLGDSVYASRKRKGEVSRSGSNPTLVRLGEILTRHALHASELSFAHPVTGKQMAFKTALPDDMAAAIAILHREDRIEGGTG